MIDESKWFGVVRICDCEDGRRWRVSRRKGFPPRMSVEAVLLEKCC